MQLLTIIVIFIILLFSFKLIDRCRCYLYLQHFSASITMNRIINYTIKYFSLYDTFMIHYLHSNAGYYWCNISLSCNWSLRLWLRLRESLLHPWSRSIKLKFHYNDYIIIGRWLHPPAFMYHFKYFVLILQMEVFLESDDNWNFRHFFFAKNGFYILCIYGLYPKKNFWVL